MDYQTWYEPADIMIHIQGKGIVLREKSVIAFQSNDNKIIAYGTDAAQMAKLPREETENLVIMSPLRQGMVADFAPAVALFSYLFTKALGKKPILKPPVAVCVPKGMTVVEQKALEEVLISAGAKELFIADVPMESFIPEFSEKLPEMHRKFKIIIGITKEESERYIEERLRDTLTYAEQEQIPPERVLALLQKLQQ